MSEIKCPHCGSIFTVDEADYAAIVSQVRNAEFDAEIQRRMEEVQERHKTEQELATERAKQALQTQLSQKDLELSTKEAEMERLKSEKDSEIASLKSQLETIEAQKKSELTVALAEKDRKIEALNSTIEQSEVKKQLAVMEERNKAQLTIQAKDSEISKLRSDAELERREAEIHEASLVKQHEEQLRAKQELVDYYKDLKLKMSTKMVGETLEQHCSSQYELFLRSVLPNAYFEKDNDANDGTKGDFIFRDTEDGVEYVSIMFEMKNEMDDTEKKHKNEHFFKKLDEDRKKKKCEYAVLVSLLEPESDLYNGGIVDVSHRYPKMYVIRPQFFIPMITLLVQTSKKTLEYQKELIMAREKEVDVTNFETKIEDFKSKFGRHYELASKKFGEAIKDIDATIVKLQKIREELAGSENNLRLANQDTEDLSIRKLTYKNPTMKAKFDEARQKGTKPVGDRSDHSESDGDSDSTN